RRHPRRGRPGRGAGRTVRAGQPAGGRNDDLRRASPRRPGHTLRPADAANPPQRTRLVGVLIPYVRGGYFPEILEGVAEAMYEHGLRLVLSPTQHEHPREVSLFDRLMQGATDGA